MRAAYSLKQASKWKRWNVAICCALLYCFASGGCRTTDGTNPRGAVSKALTDRFGSGITDPLCAGRTVIPPTVTLEDGLTEDEAIHIALWNNAGFQELLAALGISRAQLLEAGLINDPQFIIFFPLGPKQLEFATFQTVDALWLRPIRVRAAKLDLHQISQSMVQNGLNTIRDIRLAHTNLIQAQQQAEVATEAASIRGQIAELAQKRLAAGDISDLEATTSQIDALQAKAAEARMIQDVELAEHALRTGLGLTMLDAPILAVDGESADRPITVEDADQLVGTALAMRPDLRAAEIAIEAACQRVDLAKRRFRNFDLVYDANGSGKKGFESGPGLRFFMPVFNRNRGVIAIANAQWQQATRQYVTVRDRVTLEVRTAHTQLQQARDNLQFLQTEILPSLEEAERLARRSYEDGGATYFLILQTIGPYLDARMRQSQLLADVRRATAELERSVGMRLATTSLNLDISPDGFLESESP